MKQETLPKQYPAGKLAKEYSHIDDPIQVCYSAGGYYIGVMDSYTGMPVSRESEEYYPNFSSAQTALDEGTWTQRPNP